MEGCNTKAGYLNSCQKPVAVKTGFSESYLKTQHDSFIKACPDGLMTKQRFLDLSLAALGEKANFLSDSLFRVFDKDGNGAIDFTEYIMALKATSLELPDQKLMWIFDVFDKDGSGTISEDEIDILVQGIFDMSKHEYEDKDVKEACKEIMDTIDSNGDGEITKNEFIENALKSQFISDIIS